MKTRIYATPAVKGINQRSLGSALTVPTGPNSAKQVLSSFLQFVPVFCAIKTIKVGLRRCPAYAPCDVTQLDVTKQFFKPQPVESLFTMYMCGFNNRQDLGLALLMMHVS